MSAKPATGTPQLVRRAGEENVRQLVKCGNMMYAVGKFTEISQGGKTYAGTTCSASARRRRTPVRAWKVNVNGTVNTIAFTSGHGCADAYIGGSFTSVHGTAAKNIAEVSTSTGAVVTSFGHNANGKVETLLGYNNHLLDGGHSPARTATGATTTRA